MRTVPDIIDALGGSAALARETGFPITTIESWKAAEFIPDWRRAPLLEVAKAKKVKLTERCFPPRPKREASQPSAAA